MSIAYCSCHSHSAYSALDGFGLPWQIAERIKELGQTGCALTDHGDISGHADFWFAMQKAGLHAVLGNEFYFAKDMRERPAKEAADRRKMERESFAYTHLTVLAQSQKGYANLLKLSSLSWEEGHYRKPRIDPAALAAHQEGLIVLSGCVGGIVSKLINEKREDLALQWLSWFQQNVEQFFVEIVPCPGLKKSHTACPILWRMAGELKIPLVVSDDAHAPRPEDMVVQDAMLCINVNERMGSSERSIRLPDYHYRCSGEDVLDRCKKVLPNVPIEELIPAIERSIEIAEKCVAELPKSKGPVYAIPIGHTPTSLVQAWVAEGIENRRSLGLLPDLDTPEWQVYLEREAYELDIIAHHSFENYFLIVADLVRWSTAQGHWVVARGSCGGSLICYYLGISQVDPIKFKLPVERFIDKTRPDLPDVDLDFDARHRGAAFQYLEEKYGKERCAHVAALSTFGARRALQDLARVVDIPTQILGTMLALVPEEENADQGLKDTHVLTRLFEHSETAKKCLAACPALEIAARLEGQIRTGSVHAAGFIVDSKPLIETVGINARPGKDRCVSANKDFAAAQGLLKIDCLSSNTMAAVAECLETIGKNVEWLYQLPLEDRETFQMLGEGKNQGVFQIKGQAAGRMMRRLQPESFAELADVSALARPGPLQSGGAESYIDRKHGREWTPDLHPTFEPILGSTRGVILYQEQVMQIAREVAGFNWKMVHKIRKLISKSGGAHAIDEFYPSYLDGTTAQGIPDEQACVVWAQMRDAGNYLFNRAHTVAYALIGYWTAYLKCHYPSQFTAHAARWASGEDAEIKQLRLFREFVDRGGKVILADYNRSGVTFQALDDTTILCGFGDLKGCGRAIATRIFEGKPYASWLDFCERAPAVVSQPLYRSGLPEGRLDPDVVLSIAPWYPLSHLLPGEIEAKEKLQCVDIRELSGNPEQFPIGAKVLGRITERRLIDLVQQAKKYGGQVPEEGEPTIRAQLTVTDETGSIDVSFDAKTWREVCRRQEIIAGPGKGLGNTVTVRVRPSNDGLRWYGEIAVLLRVWTPYEPPAARYTGGGKRLTKKQQSEARHQLRLMFEESAS